ncbi:hypothetical protein CRUP_037951, partial [Coryphaenoides rupestris]
MHKLLEEDRDRHKIIEEKQVAVVEKQLENKEIEIKPAEKGRKLFPKSALFEKWDDLKQDFDTYIKTIEDQNPGLLMTRVKHNEQLGLTTARISGWKAATADVIKGDRKLIVSPVFDRVNYYDLEVVTYIPASHAFDWALWCMYESFRPEWYKQNDPSMPGKSPSIMGILVADRTYLGEIGVLDAGMKIYGGENVELGIRVWTCGGSIEIVPCSKIAHIERSHKPYMPDLSITMKRNALRVAEVWMDEYKHNINLAWNLPFKYTYFRGTGELYMGGIKSHTYNANRCLTDDGGKDNEPGLNDCKESVKKRIGIYWDFTQGKEIKNKQTGRCLEIIKGKLVLQQCTGQRWEI